VAWTLPKTWSVAEVVTAANMNTHLRDNLNAVEHLIARKTADETVTSSTVLQDDNHLLMSIGANEVWSFTFRLIYAALGTGDLKVAFTFPAAGDITAYAVAQNAGGTLTQARWAGATPTAAIDFAGIGATSKIVVPIFGVLVNGATPGTFTMQWAQNTSDGTATTMYTNSALWGCQLA
jgi:hypothetical protein